MSANVEELYTVVENLLSVAHTYSFLGPRGMTLAANEVATLPGDLVATLGAQTQAGGKRRKFDGLTKALEAGRLRINSRPAPILYDSVDERPKSLAIVGGTLGVVDPEYVAPSSSASEAT